LPIIPNSSVRVNFTVVITQFQVILSKEMSNINKLYERQLCNTSRTNKQSFVSVNLVNSVSTDNSLKSMRDVQCIIYKGDGLCVLLVGDGDKYRPKHIGR
jgi:hypothetical protein